MLFIEIGSTLKDFQDEAVVGFNSKISMCFCVCVFFFFFTHFNLVQEKKVGGLHNLPLKVLKLVVAMQIYLSSKWGGN